MEDDKRILFTPMRDNKKIIKVFQAYTDAIVDILKDSTTNFREYEVLMQINDIEIPFRSDIWNFFLYHEETFKILTLRFLEIQKFGGDTEIKKVVLRNNQYVKYINGLRKKKIGGVKDESVIDSKDKAYWERQNLFIEILEGNILKHYQTRKGEYFYTTVADVLNFFSGKTKSQSISGTEFYMNFLNENGSYDFNLSPESIGSYLKSITRYFRKHRVHFEGHRLNIYSLVNH